MGQLPKTNTENEDHSGEPNGNGPDGNEHCVQMYASGGKIGKWNDQICSDKFGYICQIPKIKTLVIPVPPATRLEWPHLNS